MPSSIAFRPSVTPAPEFGTVTLDDGLEPPPYPQRCQSRCSIPVIPVKRWCDVELGESYASSASTLGLASSSDTLLGNMVKSGQAYEDVERFHEKDWKYQERFFMDTFGHLP